MSNYPYDTRTEHTPDDSDHTAYQQTYHACVAP